MSSSRLSLLRRYSLGSFDLSALPPSPPGPFGRLLAGSASSSQSLYRYGRHFSEPSQPDRLTLPIPSPRRCSAPEGLGAGAGIPEVVVYPPEDEEEEMFRVEDQDGVLSHRDHLAPETGKYGTALVR